MTVRSRSNSVWIAPQLAIDEATAGRRTLVHATTKNLELLTEGITVTGAISQATERKIVTVQPWVENRDGKRFLHIPPDAGYRNLVREMSKVMKRHRARTSRPHSWSGRDARAPHEAPLFHLPLPFMFLSPLGERLGEGVLQEKSSR